jgi:hypothetical protein
MNEQELYDWLLAQRILRAVDALDAEKVAYLDTNTPGWNGPVTDDEFAHALAVDHPELNSAFETWWNRSGMSETPLTFGEIRAKAALEA